jgi:hypothetical protein
MAILDAFATKTTADGKTRYKLTMLSWIIIGFLCAAIIGLIIWGIVRLVSDKEGFVAYDHSDPKHRKIDTTPVTTYLETYISSALGCDSGNPPTKPA